MTDLLYLIYSEVKRRGGIYKMHADRANEPQTGGLKVYDYLWVGENVENADGLREATKNHTPYVVPCIQGTAAKVEGDKRSLPALDSLHAIPVAAGRTASDRGAGRDSHSAFAGSAGERVLPKRRGSTTRPIRTAPTSTAAGIPIPPNTETRPAHARWLKQYLPLVEDGTWAFLEIADSDLFATTSAERLRGFGLCQSRLAPGPGELRPIAPTGRDGRRVCSRGRPRSRTRETMAASQAVAADSAIFRRENDGSPHNLGGVM